MKIIVIESAYILWYDYICYVSTCCFCYHSSLSLQYFSTVVGSVCLLMVIKPYLLCAALPTLILLLCVRTVYLTSQRHLSRLFSTGGCNFLPLSTYLVEVVCVFYFGISLQGSTAIFTKKIYFHFFVASEFWILKVSQNSPGLILYMIYHNLPPDVTFSTQWDFIVFIMCTSQILECILNCRL